MSGNFLTAFYALTLAKLSQQPSGQGGNWHIHIVYAEMHPICRWQEMSVLWHCYKQVYFMLMFCCRSVEWPSSWLHSPELSASLQLSWELCMAPVRLAYMQLSPWSMPTAGCKVHRAGEVDTFDIILIKPCYVPQQSRTPGYTYYASLAPCRLCWAPCVTAINFSGRRALQRAILALVSIVTTWPNA